MRKLVFKPVKVSDDIYFLLKEAYDYVWNQKAALYGHRCHLSFMAVRLWWCPLARQSEIDEGIENISIMNKSSLTRRSNRLFKTDKDLILDLGRDRLKAISRTKSSKCCGKWCDFRDRRLGGNVYVLGHSNRGTDEPWNRRNPRPEQISWLDYRQYQRKTNKTVVTSGIYERI